MLFRSIVVLVGRSGAGKSTLARCLAGREPWDAGTVRVHERSLRPTQIVPAQVQLVSQEPSESLNPRWSIGECFQEACANSGSSMLEQMRMPSAWLDRKIHELSEGQRARIAIARSIGALDSGLLILDESLAGLDPVTLARVMEFVQASQVRKRLGCLLITHDDEVAEAYASRVVHLEEGRVAA